MLGLRTEAATRHVNQGQSDHLTVVTAPLRQDKLDNAAM